MLPLTFQLSFLIFRPYSPLTSSYTTSNDTYTNYSRIIKSLLLISFILQHHSAFLLGLPTIHLVFQWVTAFNFGHPHFPPPQLTPIRHNSPRFVITYSNSLQLTPLRHNSSLFTTTQPSSPPRFTLAHLNLQSLTRGSSWGMRQRAWLGFTDLHL